MHSFFFDAARDMIVEKYGEEAWMALAEQTNLPYTFEEDVVLNDDLLYQLLKHAAEAVKSTVEAVLEQIGYWFIIYIKKSPAYGNLLNMAGTTFADTLNNINSLHGHMKLSYFKNITPPTFRTTNVTSTSMRLHYIPGRPNRKNLGPLVIGLVKGLAEIHFDILSSKLKIVQEKYASKGADHDVFHISWRKAKDEKAQVPTKQQVVYSIGLDGESLNFAFPFHFVLNKKLQIVQSGSSLRKLIEVGAEDLLTNKIEIISPKIESVTYKTLQKVVGDEIVIRIIYDDTTNVEIHGEFLYLKDRSTSRDSHLCFVGSPMFKSMQEAVYVGLSLSDFAIHDPAKDRLFAFDADKVSARRRERQATDSATDQSDRSEDSYIDFSEILTTSSGPGAHVSFDKKTSSHFLHSSSSCPIRYTKSSDLPPSIKPFSPPAPPSARSSIPPPSFTDKHTLLIDTLLKDSWNKFELTKALLEISINDKDQKAFVSASIDIYTSLNRMNDLLVQAIRWELKSNRDPNQMLRQDSVSSSLIASYSKRVCMKVVKSLLTSLIGEIQQLDPDAEMIADIVSHKSRAVIEALANKFLKDLSDSVLSWPSEFTKMLSSISLEASQMKEEEGMKFAHCTIISTLFLRLIIPAISFPDKFEIAPSPRLIRYQPILVTLSKVMNNLAIGSKFDDRTPYSVYNSFLDTENQTKLNNFINNLLDNQLRKQTTRVRPLSSNLLEDFSTFLIMRIDKLFDHQSPHIRELLKDLTIAQLRSV